MCFIGIALMNYSEAQGLRFNTGDFLMLAAALFFALQIVYVGHSVAYISVRKLVLMQMLVCAAASLAMSLLTDPASLIRADYGACIFPLLYVAVLGTGLGCSAQIFAQRYTTPVKAGILMSLEGLFGAALSILLGLTPITVFLVVGTVLSVTAVILVETRSMNKQREDRP
jgi:drug/metabolite transporter (DMT)-like permease